MWKHYPKEIFRKGGWRIIMGGYSGSFKVGIGLLVLGIILSFPLFIASEGPANNRATVTEYSGQVQIYGPDGSEISLKVGQKLKSGTEILTGAKSYLALSWGSDYQVRVEENSRLILAKGDWKQAPATFWGRLKLTVGEVWVNLITKTDSIIDFSVETPTATAGVRGTSFRVFQDSSGLCEVSVAEGIVEVVSGTYSAELGPKTFIVFREIGLTDGIKAWNEQIRNKWEKREGDSSQNGESGKGQQQESSESAPKNGQENGLGQAAASEGGFGKKGWGS